jgi:hypothetical protein
MAMSNAERQRAFKQRAAEREAERLRLAVAAARPDVSQHLAALRALADAAFGKRFGTMERRALLDAVEAMERALRA